MNQENNDIDELLRLFPVLDFTEKEPVKKKVLLTLEEVLEEFPVLDFDYGTVAYYSRKYPLLPDELYEVLAENHGKSISTSNYCEAKLCVKK